MAHVALCRKEECLVAVVGHVDVLCVCDAAQHGQHVLVGQARKAHDSAPALDGLDDVCAVVARKGKARRRREDLHGAPQRLLGTDGHGVCLVENDDLVPPRREAGHLLVCKELDGVAHNVDAALVRRVQLQHALAVLVAQQRARQSQHARGLAAAGRAGKNQVRHVPLARKHKHAAQRLAVAHHVLQPPRPVLFHPRQKHRPVVRSATSKKTDRPLFLFVVVSFDQKCFTSSHTSDKSETARLCSLEALFHHLLCRLVDLAGRQAKTK